MTESKEIFELEEEHDGPEDVADFSFEKIEGKIGSLKGLIHNAIEKLQFLADLSSGTEKGESLKEIQKSVEKKGEGTEEEQEKIEELASLVLEKVSGQLGSNEGGWYEDPETGGRYYVKFYQSPGQARAEYIANAVYHQLDISAISSRLIEIDGRLAIVSPEIKGAKPTTEEQQKKSTDVAEGFIADAYLANWDVIGLVNDNIVAGEDGRLYRVDNGGSLTYRAMGSVKDYAPDSIPELESMRSPEYTAGRVFGDSLTEADIRRQAQYLVEKLTPQDIDRIIGESGLMGDEANPLRKAMLGRRQYLIDHFELEKSAPQRSEERIPIAIAELERQARQFLETELRPRVGVLADTDKIENQQIDVVDARDTGVIIISLKLTSKWFEVARERLLVNPECAGEEATIAYTKKPKEEKDERDLPSERFYLSEAVECTQQGVRVLFSSGIRGGEIVRSAIGLVQIEIPTSREDQASEKELGRMVDKVFREILGVEGGLTPPDREAERAYKRARYLWHHKIENVDDKILERLERQEVFPGYHTIVEPGKHREYREISPLCIYHEITGSDSLAILLAIFKAGGLLSSHERYRRGFHANGLSSDTDFMTGGADCVFTRIVTDEGLKLLPEGDSNLSNYPGACTIVFRPRILDRTDWYTYRHDQFGTVASPEFEQRPSPSALLRDEVERGFSSGNEQMFRTGISSEDFLAIVFISESDREAAIRLFRAKGVEEINGKPLEEFFAVAGTRGDLIDISEGQSSPRSLEAKKRREEEFEKTKAIREKIAAALEWGEDVYVIGNKKSSKYGITGPGWIGKITDVGDTDICVSPGDYWVDLECFDLYEGVPPKEWPSDLNNSIID